MSALDSLLKTFSSDIAIDLGTANIRALIRGESEIWKEPSVIAINQLTGKVLAVGNEARMMIGRTPANIVAIQPLKNGVISDFYSTEAMINYVIEKIKARTSLKNNLVKPRVVIGVPSLITEVEINAVIDSAKSAGARKVIIVEEPIAAAIGANIKIEEATGSMVVDIGGGTTDIAIISLGGIVVDNTINIAGDELDLAIIEYVKNKYNLLLGSKIAEDIKLKLGAAIPSSSVDSFLAKGQDIISGLPKSTSITSNEIVEAILPVLQKISTAMSDALEKSPPEVLADIYTNGIVLSGGGALIKNIDKYFSQKLKVPVVIAKDPIFSVVRGIAKMLDNIDLLEKMMVKDLILR